MKKYRKLLILLGVFIVLIIVYISLKGYNTDKAKKEAEKNTVKITDIASLKGIAYESEGQSMEFVKEKKKWYYKKDKDFPLYQSYPESLEKQLKELTATRELKSGDSLEDYGLKTPSTTITLTAKDGKETKLYVGSAAGEDYYVTVDDKKKVYTVEGAAVSELQYDLNSMVKPDTFPTIGSDNLKEVSITEKGKTTVYKADDKKQKKDIASISGGLGTFSFTSCASYDTKTEDLKNYGLDEDSRITVKITYKDDDKKTQTVTLYVGSQDQNGQSYYVQKEGSKMVNTASIDVVTSILNKSSK